MASKDITVIETSQESNPSIKNLVNSTVHNLSNSSKRDSVELFAESECAEVEQLEIQSKDYKRESLDLFEGSFEKSKFSITVSVSQQSNPDSFSNKSITDSYQNELASIKTPKEPEEKWDCNIGGESILEMSQRDIGSKKRKREDDFSTEKDNSHVTFLEPQPKYKKMESSSSKAIESYDNFENTMFPDSIRIDTQLEQLLNSNDKSNINSSAISAGMSDSVMQLAFQNTFNSMSNTIISPKKCNIVNDTCKDLVISDSEDMIAGSQDTTSSGPSPRKYVNFILSY